MTARALRIRAACLIVTGALLSLSTVPALAAPAAPADVPPQACAKGQAPSCLPKGSSGGAARADYNGDGFSDLAVGTPYEDIGSVPDAGMVQVMYGSSLGLNTDRSAALWQSRDGLAGTAEPDDRFGSAVAGGDFDGDGYSDLAIGIPGQDPLKGSMSSGAVQVVYGSPSGLNPARSQTLRFEPSAVWSGTTGVSFGRSLVWGNFGRGPQADLAIAGRFALDSGAEGSAGFVAVWYGSASGLTAVGGDAFALRSGADRYGDALAAGHLTGTAEDELVVGAPYINEVKVYGGTADGLYGIEFTVFPDGCCNHREFGSSLAIGDFDGISPKDLAVGSPGTIGDRFSECEGCAQIGEVLVRYGSGQNQRLAAYSLPDSNAGDRFGAAVAAGDFNADLRIDLAIGAPGWLGTGAILVVDGATGLTDFAGPPLRQGFGDLQGTAEAGDGFGSVLSGWNWGLGTATDLAVGVASEDVGNTLDAGALQVLYGGSGGLGSGFDQLFTQDLFGFAVETGDRFGWSAY